MHSGFVVLTRLALFERGPKGSGVSLSRVSVPS